jgi:bifunctional NMN adenylyltransferase/nudix hydrolase
VSKSIDRLRKCPGGLEFSSTYDNTNICLVGHHKEGDRSNFYLDMFPQWKYVESETTFLSDGKLLDASDIRDSYFSGDHPFSLAVPNSVANFLVENSTTHWFFRLKLERLYYLNYSREWGTGPFVTVDSFVYCCGHVLLIQRKNHPGNGLYALPGGFLENNETISAGIIRELKEETNIRVPIPVLHGFMKHIEVFDVNRSLRGRIVTHCGLINLRNDTHLPEVRGDDDAEKAMWVPTSEILSNYRHIMFEDHFDIVTKMISLIK